jgi:hypothetical protein
MGYHARRGKAGLGDPCGLEEDRIYALALLSDSGLQRQELPGTPQLHSPRIDQRLIEKGLVLSTRGITDHQPGPSRQLFLTDQMSEAQTAFLPKANLFYSSLIAIVWENPSCSMNQVNTVLL